MEHELKIEDVYLRAIESGDKTFEVRLNDRNYQKGDTIDFVSLAGRKVWPWAMYLITNVHSGLGLKEGYVVLAIHRVETGGE